MMGEVTFDVDGPKLVAYKQLAWRRFAAGAEVLASYETQPPWQGGKGNASTSWQCMVSHVVHIIRMPPVALALWTHISSRVCCDPDMFVGYGFVIVRLCQQ